jgi:hypothetical protein
LLEVGDQVLQSGVGLGGMVDESVYGLDHGIVHVGGNRIGGETQLRGMVLAAGGVLAGQDAGGNAHRGRTCRNVAYYDCI